MIRLTFELSQRLIILSICECQTKTTSGGVDAADSLTGYSSDHNPTTDFQS